MTSEISVVGIEAACALQSPNLMLQSSNTNVASLQLPSPRASIRDVHCKSMQYGRLPKRAAMWLI